MKQILPRMGDAIYKALAVALSLFILLEVNYPLLTPQARLSIFAMLGLVLIFIATPIHERLAGKPLPRLLDFVLVLAAVLCFGYVLVQSDPLFKTLWLDGQPLGNRAGAEMPLDYVVGFVGVLLVLEATRRTIGLTLPLLAIAFLCYAAFGPAMPDWFFPHRGYSWQRIVSQTFLHSQGVFGIALKVMFTYVFLFVLFGTLLEKTGATAFIINFARNLFRNSPGGPAKVAVVSSGMMGSLSGSAVANTATTGTFTIPMMLSSGFRAPVAAGVEAAASSGGALVPPIMGAGAYMMLELIEPAVTYVQIIKAALIPALLYYTALLLIVHLQAKRVGATALAVADFEPEKSPAFRGVVFFSAFVTLIFFLVMGYTPFRAVSVSLVLILLVGAFSEHTRVNLKGVAAAMVSAARSGVSLVAAASCVGLIIGVVTLTGIGSKLPSTILPLAQNNLILALLLIMVSTIILGMGLPSAVCYLLMATLIGPVLGKLGLVPLAAHLFIFYFGMMSMVTPPVALAAYTAAAIAKAGIMQTAFAAFRFSLVGFALPFAFVLRPELLLLSADGSAAGVAAIVWNVMITLLGIVPLAASMTGYLFAPLGLFRRLAFLVAGLTFILTKSHGGQLWLQLAALLVVLIIGFLNWRHRATLVVEQEALSVA
ncbi:MAG: TRAP transporter fused permease subunit [Calditrichaeota bacterium]|nr:TRAP transporter fused permease subunit [Calditrichota bacterium]